MELSDEELIDMFRYMLMSRRFDEAFVRLYYEGKALECPHSLIGQEAIGIGACYKLRKDDYVLPSLRTRTVFFIRGVPLKDQMAGVCGKANSYTKGTVSTLHIADPEKRILGATGVVGSQEPIATGAALACKIRKVDSVVVCFLGDGASNRGDFHEALNFAAIKKLPVVFVVENNQFGEWTPISRHMAIKNIADRAIAYGFPGIVVDGNDLIAVHEAIQEAVKRARREEGPTLLECKTYRLRDHCEGLGADARPKEEIEEWEKKDPIKRFKRQLLEKGILTEEAVEKMDKEIMAEVEEAVRFAEECPWPEPEEILRDVYSPEKPFAELTQRERIPGREISMGRALNEALREEMMRDENVILLGEDIGPDALLPSSLEPGAIWPPTANLCKDFPERVIGTPISESEIVGAAVGAALAGMRPVAEIMYADFMTIANDQIANTAAKMRYNYVGKASVPIVVRTTIGVQYEGCWHSQSTEAWLLNVPGLKIVMPSTPYDAKGLLKASIRDDDPVIFFEHKKLYGIKGMVPERDYVVPLGVADVKREGKDITLVATALMVHKALSAAEELQQKGIDIEVIDPRTLLPLDKKTILSSVKKTGRLIIVHEACKTGGFGAEVAAIVAEEALDYLDAPIVRIAAPEAPPPFSKPLVEAYEPSEKQIISAVLKMAESM